MGIKHKRVVATGDRGEHDDWNDDHEIDGDVECSKHQHKEHVVENRTDWPVGPVEGQIIYRTDEDRLYVWDGAKWISPPWYHSGAAKPVMTYDGEICIWKQTLFAEAMVEWYTGAVNQTTSIYLLEREAQSFTVGTIGPVGNHNLTKISLYLIKVNVPPANLIVELQGDAAGQPNGVVLSTGSLAPPGAGSQWFDIAMTPFLLVNGTKYHIVCYCATCNGGGFYRWWQNNGGNPYAGGNRCESHDGGATWVIHATDDHRFQVWGIPVVGLITMRLVTREDANDYAIVLPQI